MTEIIKVNSLQSRRQFLKILKFKLKIQKANQNKMKKKKKVFIQVIPNYNKIVLVKFDRK